VYKNCVATARKALLTKAFAHFLTAENLKAENYDPRSLYERLQEQKDKKQSEIDEQRKFSVLVVMN
jgi:hypothetical protein